jgi:hypothetical protein
MKQLHKQPTRIQMKKIAIAVIAPLIGAASSLAGDVAASTSATAPVSSSQGFSPTVGVSGVFGEQTEGLGGSSYDVAGVRVDLGHDLGSGFSFAGRFEHLEGDGGVLGSSLGSSTSGAGLGEGGIDSNEFRLLLNYGQEVAQGLSLFGGIGYGWQNHDLLIGGTSIFEASSNGILLNAGLDYTSGPFFGSLVYTHAFTLQSENGIGAGAFALGGSLGALGGLITEKEDFGLIELTAGYNINEQLAATLSLETQVFGDTFVEKDWALALGLKYSF